MGLLLEVVVENWIEDYKLQLGIEERPICGKEAKKSEAR